MHPELKCAFEINCRNHKEMEYHFIERQLPQAPNTMSSSPQFMTEINIIFWHLLIKVYHLWMRHTRQQKNKINKTILKHGKSYSSILLVLMRVLLILHSYYPMHKMLHHQYQQFYQSYRNNDHLYTRKYWIIYYNYILMF